MNIDHLIKMANEITSFWAGELGKEGAAAEVASHLRRFWEPRMRAQMIAYVEERQGAGLNEVAVQAVRMLAAQAEAPAEAAPVDKVAPALNFTRGPDPADPNGGDAG